MTLNLKIVIFQILKNQSILFSFDKEVQQINDLASNDIIKVLQVPETLAPDDNKET